MSDLKIPFSNNLSLELKHLNHNLIEMSLIETPINYRNSKTLMAVRHITKPELEAFLQNHELMA